MQLFRKVRLFLLALLASVTAASVHAQLGISINVSFAPPMLPVYVQPMCPQPNLMWTPGYWAYSYDEGDYFWVPGAWVPAPYEGALWTPPYWSWNNGQYGFHDGYWGETVGFYGGVNYGFGFGGVGFAGGEWRGGSFAYNTAVVHVDETVVHVTYVNETIVRTNIVENPNHMAYNGGPNGIQRTATPAEQAFAQQPHTAPTTFQTQHAATAKADKTSFSKANAGHPANLVAAKPLAEEKAAPPAGMKAEAAPAEKAAPKPEAGQPSAPAARETPAGARPEAEPTGKVAPKPEAGPPSAPAARVAPSMGKPEAAPTEKAAPKSQVEQPSAPAARETPAGTRPEAQPAERTAPRPETDSLLRLRPVRPRHRRDQKHGLREALRQKQRLKRSRNPSNLTINSQFERQGSP